MQRSAFQAQPGARPVAVAAQPLDQPPEAARVVVLDEVGDLVRGQVVEHERRRHDQPPRERQVTLARARAPTRALVAETDLLWPHTERRGMAERRRLEIPLGLPLE